MDITNSKITISNIDNADKALCFLFNLNQDDLERAIKLCEKLKKKGSDLYEDLNNEDDEKFLKEYKKALTEGFGDDLNIINVYKKYLKAEFNDINSFSENLLNKGMIFSRDISKKLKDNGAKLKYELNSWPKAYYEIFKKEKYIKLKDCYLLFTGSFPTQNYSSTKEIEEKKIVDLREDALLFYSLGEYPFAFMPSLGDGYQEKIINLKDRVKNHIVAGDIKSIKLEDSEILVDVEDMIKWLHDNTEYQPNDTLIEVFDLEDKGKDERIEALIKEGKELPKENSRRNAINKIIEKYYLEFKESNSNTKVSAIELFWYIKKKFDSDKYDNVIINMDKDKVIEWKSENMLDSKTLQFNSFRNIVSKLNQLHSNNHC